MRDSDPSGMPYGASDLVHPTIVEAAYRSLPRPAEALATAEALTRRACAEWGVTHLEPIEGGRESIVVRGYAPRTVG